MLLQKKITFYVNGVKPKNVPEKYKPDPNYILGATTDEVSYNQYDWF